jgi:putative endonuclease
MLRCGDGSLYTGIATDVARRIGEHEKGKRGAKCLRGRGPFKIVYQRSVGDRSIASRIEYRVKQLPRAEKEKLELLPSRIDELLNELQEVA